MELAGPQLCKVSVAPFRFISRRIKESKSRRHVSTTPVRCTSLGVTGANPEVTCELGVLAALAGFRNWGGGVEEATFQKRGLQ